MSEKIENIMNVWEATDKIRAWIVYHPNDDDKTVWIIMQDGGLHFLKEIDIE